MTSEQYPMRSEGKLIVVKPRLYDPYGVPFFLPEARYVLQNGILGYEDSEVLNGDYVQAVSETWSLPVIRRTQAFTARLGVDFRMMEYAPSVGPVFGDDTTVMPDRPE